MLPATLDRFSEPFPPHGALAAEGAENLLGRPRLDPLVVLVREAVQNSWDARLDDRSVVDFAIRAHHLDAVQRGVLQSTVFDSPPPAADRLREVLQRDDVLLLSLTDAGTTGLGGPVRADRPPKPGQSSNFVDLLFNIGQPSDREFGGGTYGFGKTISFVVSEARAVIVHSRTAVGDTLQSRFIAAGFTDHFSADGRRYTGRHWWGRSVEESILPIVGGNADAFADVLGLPPFDEGQTGTTICVVAPGFRGRTPRQAMNFLADAIVWNFWPKMVAPAGGAPSMRFAITFESDPVPVPDPDDVAPLHAYADALRGVRSALRLAANDGGSSAGAGGATRDGGATSAGADDTVQLHAVKDPKSTVPIGWLGLARIPVLPRSVADDGRDAGSERQSAAAFEGLAHHVALLREPELVVEYLECPALPSVVTEWVGVFKAVPELDRAFAAAEPPTHDSWRANLVRDDAHRRSVAMGMRNLIALSAAFANDESCDRRPAAQIADALSGLLAGPSHDEAGATRPAQPELPAVSFGPVHRLPAKSLRISDHRVSDIDFVVSHRPGCSGTVVEATAFVATHDGDAVEREPRERRAAARSSWEPVEIVGFVPTKRGDDGAVEVAGSRLVVVRGRPNRWRVRVRSLPDIAVAVDMVVTPLDEAAS
ncbi:MAG: hypothetical protein HYX32_09275 [Actinobacteria bacterium]|nr:hypothetical protein [Actinomycetota bacterium]